ncbi:MULTISPECIES: hypothetical protein [Bartonella]|nr:hypothetical protein [Bartonella choladocola]MBI0140839.1 hypothetical protein [Bartonella choladocola]
MQNTEMEDKEMEDEEMEDEEMEDGEMDYRLTKSNRHLISLSIFLKQ